MSIQVIQQQSLILKKCINQIKQLLKCPITWNRIVQPAITYDGILYEKTSIHQHLKQNDKSPYTNLYLKSKITFDCIAIKNISQILTQLDSKLIQLMDNNQINQQNKDQKFERQIQLQNTNSEQQNKKQKQIICSQVDKKIKQQGNNQIECQVNNNIYQQVNLIQQVNKNSVIKQKLKIKELSQKIRQQQKQKYQNKQLLLQQQIEQKTQLLKNAQYKIKKLRNKIKHQINERNKYKSDMINQYQKLIQSFQYIIYQLILKVPQPKIDLIFNNLLKKQFNQKYMTNNLPSNQYKFLKFLQIITQQTNQFNKTNINATVHIQNKINNKFTSSFIIPAESLFNLYFSNTFRSRLISVLEVIKGIKDIKTHQEWMNVIHIMTHQDQSLTIKVLQFPFNTKALININQVNQFDHLEVLNYNTELLSKAARDQIKDYCFREGITMTQDGENQNSFDDDYQSEEDVMEELNMLQK